MATLAANGGSLLYSTYLGGSGDDSGYGIAEDTSGAAYVTGSTTSADYSATAGVVQPGHAAGSCAGVPCADAFVSKLNASGSALLYSTFLGGAGSDIGYGIALDSSADAYVTGSTTSSAFPTTGGAYQPHLRGGMNAFVAKLLPTGTVLVYGTYLGGSGSAVGYGIAVDRGGQAHLTGATTSVDFPLANAAQGQLRGGRDAFVSTLNAAGSGLVYSTYLGGGAGAATWGQPSRWTGAAMPTWWATPPRRISRWCRRCRGATGAARRMPSWRSSTRRVG